MFISIAIVIQIFYRKCLYDCQCKRNNNNNNNTNHNNNNDDDDNTTTTTTNNNNNNNRTFGQSLTPQKWILQDSIIEYYSTLLPEPYLEPGRTSKLHHRFLTGFYYASTSLFVSWLCLSFWGYYSFLLTITDILRWRTITLTFWSQ